MKKALNCLPRTIAVVYILFLSVFALDAFDAPGRDARAVAFLAHLVPSLLFAAALAVAWRRRAIGGLLFVALAVALTVRLRTDLEWANFVALSVPPVVAGALFILSSTWFSRQR